MKRLFMLFAGAMMALSLAACSPANTGTEAETKQQETEITATGIQPGDDVAEMETEDPRLSKVSDPNAPELDTVIIYSVREGRERLDKNMCESDELNVDNVVALLIEYGVLDSGTSVKSFEIEGGEKSGPGVDPSAVGEGERIGTLNLSEMPGDTDKATLAAIGNSFCENFELDKLAIQVDGEPYSHEWITDGYVYYFENYGKLN